MPELPEVETIVRGLAACIVGKQIASVTVTLARIVIPEQSLFVTMLRGRTIAACSRRAKYIVMMLDNGYRVVVHLRMTGRMMFEPVAHNAAPKYTHVTIRFTDDSRLFFADARTFGRMRIVEPGENWDSALGVEPLSDDFSLACFGEILQNRTTPIKTFLLDQRHIAGVGNIYACEALWQAHIAPTVAAGSLKPAARAALHEALRDVLRRSVEMRGTSARDYVDAEGLKGGFQNVLAVYGRHGEDCRDCGFPIERMVLAQRGTWWCRQCQPEKKHRKS